MTLCNNWFNWITWSKWNAKKNSQTKVPAKENPKNAFEFKFRILTRKIGNDCLIIIVTTIRRSLKFLEMLLIVLFNENNWVKANVKSNKERYDQGNFHNCDGILHQCDTLFLKYISSFNQRSTFGNIEGLSSHKSGYRTAKRKF